MAETRHYCAFYLDGILLGIEVARVQEVVRYQEMTRLPLAMPGVEGLINLRGQIVTVLDLRRRLGLDERPDDQHTIIVVVHAEEGVVSLIVDEIGDVLEVDVAACEQPPATLKGEARLLIRGAYKLHDQLLLDLDTDAALSLGQS